MQKFIVLFCSALIISGSCNIAPEKDQSLTVAEYKKLGMPDPGKSWNHQDYEKAYIALSKLRAKEPHALPRKGSPRSGVYFDRMTDIRNMTFLNDDAIPLTEKAYQIQSYILIQHDLSDLYSNIFGPDRYYDREVIDLYLFGLSIMREMMQLSRTIGESENIGDRQMQAGLPALQYSFMTMINYILDDQKNASAYRTADLERLTDSVYVSVQRNVHWMKADTRKELENRIQIVMDSVESDHIHQKYSDLIGILSEGKDS